MLKAEGQNPAAAARGRVAPRDCIAALAVLLCTVGAAAPLGASGAPREDSIRLELVLEPAELPAADRERFYDRLDAIRASLAADLPLFRSFDPREVLAESLAALAGLGVEVGEESGAILNFDSLEADLPAAARASVEALPWIREARNPVVATSSGTFDSEGLEVIGSEVANLAGVTGQGITVAIIDDGFNFLDDTIASCWDDDFNPGTPCVPLETELKNIPIGSQYRVNRGATLTVNVFLDGLATQTLDGEHGAAAAEVVYEVAPDVEFLLIGFDPQAAGTQYSGNVTSAQLQFAIREAANLGADVILIPMFIMSTMSNPIGIGSPGGTNAFTDDVDYATGLGAVVVVSAGNEGLRTVEETFSPCTNCNTIGSGGICQTTGNPNNTTFHKWNSTHPLSNPLNDLLFSDEVLDVETGIIEQMTCYTATDAATPSNFEVRLYDFRDDFDAEPACNPFCPGDACVTIVPGTTFNLNEGFSVENEPFFSGEDEDEHIYYITVRRKSGSETPRIRVVCTTSVAELGYYTEDAQSLSDLAVLTNAVSVGAVDDIGFAICEEGFSGHCSSRGPTSLVGGPVKPDVVGPGYVTNYTALGYGVSLDEVFVGSSAAAAHVAGLAALLQSQALQETGSMLTPAQVRSALIRGAIPLAEDPGDEFLYGAGLAHIPDPAPGPLMFTPLTPCRVIDTRNAPGPNGGPSLQGGVEREFPVAGICGIPTTAKAVSGIITVVAPSMQSHVRLYPGDALLPNTSAINFQAGRTIANNAMLKLSDNGEGSIRAYLPVGTANFLFDATGYYE